MGQRKGRKTMGWDGTTISHYKNGKPDIMAEFKDRYESYRANMELVKAVKVGTTVYSANRLLPKDRFEMGETGREMLKKQSDLAEQYGYKEQPPIVALANEQEYIEKLPSEMCKDADGKIVIKGIDNVRPAEKTGFEIDGKDIPLYSRNGTKIAERYGRIVIGQYGAFLEIDPKDMCMDNVKVREGQEYRVNNPYYAEKVKYQWFTAKDESDCKLYFQQKGVTYADYKPNKWYISPYEVLVDWERDRLERTGEVFAMVSLTSRDGEWLMWKEMHEADHPYYYDCPKSILNLLTPTDNKNANEWREGCIKYQEEKKTSPAYIKNTEIGDRIIYDGYMGQMVLIHMPPYAQFKTDFWGVEGQNSYLPKEHIKPKDVCLCTLENLEDKFVAYMEMLGSKELESGMPNIIKNGNEVKIPQMYSALLDLSEEGLNSYAYRMMSRTVTMTVNENGMAEFRRDGHDKNFDLYKEPYTKDDLPEKCREAVREFEDKFREYAKSVGKADVEQITETIQSMQSFGKKDITTEKKEQKGETR